MSAKNKFGEKILSGEFTVTVEINSPKGTDVFHEIKGLEQMVEMVDAVNICDCPMANMRMSPIATAHIVHELTGIEAIPHFTCRDRNIIALQSELLGAWALGIKNILAITGDPPQRGDHPHVTGVFEVDSAGLVKLAKELNRGFDLSGNELRGSTDFIVGVACNPGAEDLNAEIDRLKQKIDSGADFIQTQPIYDPDVLLRFRDRTSNLGVPILAGILPLKSHKMAVHLNDKVPGISIPLKYIERMKKGPEEGVAIAMEFMEQILPYVNGFHIMPLGNTATAIELLNYIDTIKVRKVI